VLTYELTSEPAICDAGSWYGGYLQGQWFTQCVVCKLDGRDPYRLARAWTRDLRHAIRTEDRRHLISIGLLPVPYGAFGPENVSGLLSLLVVHSYPVEGHLGEALAVIRDFAAQGRPVLLGETFMLSCSQATWERFMLDSRRYLVGSLTFFDGRAPAEVTGTSIEDLMYRQNLSTYLALRPTLVGGR
jgi:hypothetical protein